ncbi:hypothetical protein OHR68_42195 [Spirillospora sp. NBC_00431]
MPGQAAVQVMVELAAPFSQQPGTFSATVRTLVREYLGPERIFQLALRVLKRRLSLLQWHVEHCG